MSIKLSIPNLRDEVAPLYRRYPSQGNPQPAYIQIEKDGTVSADFSGEIGNAIPFHVFHGQTLRRGVSPFVIGSALADYLESQEGMLLLGRIHAGHSIKWDGHNNVGRQDEDSMRAQKELEDAIEELPQATIYSAEEWIEYNSLSKIWPAGKTLSEAAEAASIPNEANEVIDGDMEAAILSEARRLYDYPSNAAKYGRWDIAQALVEDRWDDDDLHDLGVAVLCAKKEGMAWLPENIRNGSWIDDYDLYDSDTDDRVLADDLGIDAAEYAALIRTSLESTTAEGHVTTSTGRRVYAQV